MDDIAGPRVGASTRRQGRALPSRPPGPAVVPASFQGEVGKVAISDRVTFTAALTLAGGSSATAGTRGAAGHPQRALTARPIWAAFASARLELTLLMARSAGDHQFIADVGDAGSTPGSVYYRVMLAPGLDMPGDADRAVGCPYLEVGVTRQKPVSE